MTDRPGHVAWFRDGRAWLIIGSLLVIAILDLVMPQVGFTTLLAVPVVASVVLGRPAWTVGFSAIALSLFAVVSLPGGIDALLFWRRLAVLVLTCALSVWLARHVEDASERLSDDAEYFRLMAENSNDVVFRGSNGGVIEWISAPTELIAGWTKADLLGRPFREFIHADDIPIVAAAQTDLLAGKQVAMRIRFRTVDGDFHWVAITAHPLFDSSGAVIGRLGGWSDVNDLVVAREMALTQGQQIQAMLDSQLDPFVHFTSVRDEAGRIVDLRFAEANTAAFEYNRSTPEAMIGHTFLEFFPGLLEHGPMRQYLNCAETGEPVILDDYAYPNEILHDDRRYDIRAVQATDGIVLTWRDVTDRHRAMEQLADSERRYRLLAENATDVIWQVAADDRIEWSSESVTPVLGWRVDEVVGQAPIDMLHPDEQEEAGRARQRMLDGGEVDEEYRVRRSDGSYLWMAIAVRAFHTPEGMARVVTLHDIDAEVRARADLARLVGRDSLTGLVTRDVMQQRIRDLSESLNGGRVVLMCVGVDSLSAVNEAYGHSTGDVVLVTVATRIVAETGDPEMVARGAGVDFLILAADEEDTVDTAGLAERIRQASRAPLMVDGHQIRPTVSIGIATGAEGDEPEQLIRAATLAMRTAKEAGRDRVAYATAELAAEAERRLTLVTRIADGLTAGEFVPWFQPITDLASGQTRGYEALARWIRPDGTVSEPDDFIPLLESSPLIARLDLQVLEATLAVLATLPPPMFVSVNVSPPSLATDVYVDLITATLDSGRVDPASLHLEVTETALLTVSKDVLDRMRRIASSGVSWYVDDFGMGYSSIAHLRDLPISGLKLDLSFTAGVGSGDVRSVRLAQALAGMAQGLELDTVAEGIETAEQAAILAAQGWRHGQGWLFGKAQPLSAYASPD